MRNLTIAAIALGLTGPAFGANLVTNGSFEAGNTGFTSSYGYVAPAPNSMYPEGVYTVSNDASVVHDQWVAAHGVGGSGNFLIVNGKTEAGNFDVWRSGSINVTAATDYFFEAFATNLCCNANRTGPASLLTFKIVGDVTGSQVLGTFSTANAAVGTWQPLSNLWNSGANTSVQLFLVNASTDYFGNDFGVDQINFDTQSAIPEPATWALMIGGFGLAGAALRRKASKVSFA
ncbi:MAG TPA: PEPxxWA-CTERM sorting domain-containing protein [Sphingomonas sp.]|nr:PEPxxWA-CTERM sorting domain-containing protein [Sphingomonas sp.]